MSMRSKVVIGIVIGLCGIVHANDLVTSADTIDLNNDGLLDLAIAQPNRNAVSICLANGKDGFHDPILVPMSTPIAVRYADVDGDGKEELLALSQFGSELTVTWFDNDGLPVALDSQVLGQPAMQILTLRDSDRKTSMIMLADKRGSLWELGRVGIVLDLDASMLQDPDTGLRHDPDENVAFAFPPDIRRYRPPYFPSPNDINQCGGASSPSESGVCSRAPQDPGVQACLDAAWCRWADCMWAACILRQSGQINLAQYHAQVLACTAVHMLEMVACAPSQILN